jgi:hypothetical protein
MRLVLLLCFFTSTFSAIAQDSTYRLHAVGIDAFKNVPFLTFFQEKATLSISSEERSSFYNPLIVEAYGQITTLKPNTFLNAGIGYASIERRLEQRLRQNIKGYYLKIGKEYHSKFRHSIESIFWGYNLILTQTTVEGLIDLQGNYFPSYSTQLPTDSGFGIGSDFSVGFSFLLFRRLQTRVVSRSGIAISKIGSPNGPYLPGVGIRLSNSLLSLSGGATIQLFYLIKRFPNRNLSN